MFSDKRESYILDLRSVIRRSSHLQGPGTTSLAELQTALGIFGYYARYIPNFSTLVELSYCTDNFNYDV